MKTSTSSMASIISTANIINNLTDRIYDINEQLNSIVETGNSNTIKQLQKEKAALIHRVVSLRKYAVHIIFKDSGEYTYLDDEEEFNSNMSPVTNLLYGTQSNQTPIIPLLKRMNSRNWRGKGTR